MGGQRARTLAGCLRLACLALASSGAVAASSGYASTQTAETAVVLPNRAFCAHSDVDLAITNESSLFFFSRRSRSQEVRSKVGRPHSSQQPNHEQRGQPAVCRGSTSSRSWSQTACCRQR